MVRLSQREDLERQGDSWRGLKLEEHTSGKDLGINKEKNAVVVSKYIGSLNRC